MTKAEKEHLDRVAQLCCIACRQFGVDDSPAEIHHIRDGYGAAQRAPYDETIPLCATHHRNGPHGIAYHAGPKAFERRYGTERKLLEQVRGLLDG